MNLFKRLLTLFAVTLAVSISAQAVDSWDELFRVQTPATQTLRGFGRVETDFAAYQNGKRKVWVQTFRCESGEKAALVVGKFLADLGLSPKVETNRIKANGQDIPLMSAAGGLLFIGCVNGSEARIVCSVGNDGLEAFIKTRPELVRGAVDKAAYPTYLDRFDRYGWGVYGLDGYRNTHDWMGVAAKLDGKKELKDPYEDFQWLVKLQNRFEPHLDPDGTLGNADGIITNADDDWSVKLAKEQGLPVSFRLYGSAQSNYHGWLLRRFGQYQNQPADFLIPHIGSYAVEMMQSWYAPDAHRYQAVKAMEMVKKYAGEPHVMGWMHPYGEIQVGTWEYDHGDYGPYARSSWQDYLRKQGCDLAEASRLYERKVNFGDWEQIPVPEFATFAGLDGQILNLGGKWWSRPEVSVDEKIDDAWWKKSPEERYQGLREKWWLSATEGKDWQLVNAPGGGGLPQKTSASCSTWFKRSFALAPDQLNPQSAFPNPHSPISNPQSSSTGSRSAMM